MNEIERNSKSLKIRWIFFCRFLLFKSKYYNFPSTSAVITSRLPSRKQCCRRVVVGCIKRTRDIDKTIIILLHLRSNSGSRCTQPGAGGTWNLKLVAAMESIPHCKSSTITPHTQYGMSFSLFYFPCDDAQGNENCGALA